MACCVFVMATSRPSIRLLTAANLASFSSLGVTRAWGGFEAPEKLELVAIELLENYCVEGIKDELCIHDDEVSSQAGSQVEAEEVAGESNEVPNASASADVPPLISAEDSDPTATENEAVSELNRLQAELAEKSCYGGGINIATGKTTRGRQT